MITLSHYLVLSAVLFAISALLVYRHQQNISKLLKGTEAKLGASRQPGKTGK